jgi:hypothetical protein
MTVKTTCFFKGLSSMYSENTLSFPNFAQSLLVGLTNYNLRTKKWYSGHTALSEPSIDTIGFKTTVYALASNKLLYYASNILYHGGRSLETDEK